MSKVFDEKSRRFVDRLPMTAAAETRAAGKTQDCRCPAEPKSRTAYTQWDLVPSATRGATADKALKRARWTDRDGVLPVAKKSKGA